ncbi:MAG TPA: dihydroorotate dehydrogenase-like protein, partial [Bacteroidales bacterium]|nr:dihydroorotate dehydrogenase-like protein [Bacteroidales bacterium]
ILKSLFEEQIRYEIATKTNETEQLYLYPEANDYIKNYARTHHIEEYLNLIEQAKKTLSVPVIASINCISNEEWTSFAKQIEKAKADALEINIFILPSDTNLDCTKAEQIHFDIIRSVKKEINIPIAIKISNYFSGLTKFITKLSWEGINGIVLFNRSYMPDIDIDNFKIIPANNLSNPEDISTSLRWVALMYDKISCDIAASTGIHDGKGAIKQILAGAKVVQICSTLYKNGFEIIPQMLDEIKNFMIKNNFKTLEDFRGKMCLKNINNPADYERTQFMKYFANI